MLRKSLVAAVVAVVLSVGVLNGQAVLPSATVTLPADITCLSGVTPSSDDGQSPIVAAGLADGQIALWNGRDATATLSKPHTSRVLAVRAAGGVVLSLADDGSLARSPLAASGAATTQRLDLGTAPTRAAEFSPDGALLVTGGEFGEIRVFETASGVLKQQIRGHRTELQALALRPGSSTLASASAESDLRIWDIATGRAVADIPGDLSLFALAFSPADGTLASGGVDRRVTLRSPSTFKTVNQVALKAPKLVATLAWSPDGRLIALGDLDDETLSKGGIQIIDASTRQALENLDTTGIAVRALAFPNQTTVVAIVDRTLRAWSVQQPTQIDAVRASPDRFKVLLDNKEVRVVEYVLQPGERDHWHTHPPKVSYIVTGGSLRITLADGTSFISEERTGSAVWMDELGRHYATNVGKTPVRIVLTEVKGAAITRNASMETKIRTMAGNYAAAWSSQNAARVASYFATDGSLQINTNAPAVGRAAITASAQSFMTAFPDMVVSMDRLAVDGSSAVFHWTLKGTNSGPGGTGKTVRFSGYEEWTIDSDGLITRSLGHYDEAEYLRQLKEGLPGSQD